MTPEELNKKASLSDDAIDQANLKLALMQHDAQQSKEKIVSKIVDVQHEADKVFVATVSWCLGFSMGLLCGSVLMYVNFTR